MKPLGAIQRVLDADNLDEVAKLGVIRRILDYFSDERKIEELVSRFCREKREVPEAPATASVISPTALAQEDQCGAPVKRKTPKPERVWPSAAAGCDQGGITDVG